MEEIVDTNYQICINPSCIHVYFFPLLPLESNTTLFFETQENSLAIPGPKKNWKLEVSILSLDEKAWIKGSADLQTGEKSLQILICLDEFEEFP